MRVGLPGSLVPGSQSLYMAPATLAHPPPIPRHSHPSPQASSSDSDSSSDEEAVPARSRKKGVAVVHHRDGTVASASGAELKIAAQLAKDPWGRWVLPLFRGGCCLPQ